MSLDRALEIVTVTHPGMVRSHNEDAVVADAARGFAVLADGMGGYNAGEVASGIAVNLISEGLRTGLDAAGRGQPDMGALLREQAMKANGVIYQTAQSQPQCAGMGTTLVMALFHDNRIFTAHVGDSRLYRLRGEELAQLTRDHSLLQDQIDSGMITPEAARLSHNRNLVTRALGVDPQVDVALGEHEARPGDIYLLCSDGLNDMVEDEDIRLTLTVMGPNLPLAAEQLIQMANDNGGRDNVSVILVKVLQDFAAPRNVWSRLLSWLGL
ncbi:MAG: Stp1/IreP family PP2C-type Ser/Thr phosphatase [Sulfuricellaceae bacterium]|jgi:serine/threonine protein phosphatase PrpC